MPSPDLRTVGRFVVPLALLLLSTTAHAQRAPCPQASMQRLALPRTAAAVAAHEPVTLVAFGSSSTAGSGASAPDRTYPARLEAMLRAAWPSTPVHVINAGIGGETADLTVTRLDRDVLARHPVLVIWQAGTNDALQDMAPRRFDAAIDDGLNRLAAAGADVVLMDNQLAPRVEHQPNNRIYDTMLARDAAHHHDSLFSRLRMMLQWGARADADMVGPDGLHHTDRGYACLARALGQAIVSAVTMRMAGSPY